MKETDKETDILTRWRLILGGGDADGTDVKLSESDGNVDESLSALYEYERKQQFDYGAGSRKGGSGASSPQVSRWLGDIRKYFPSSVVKVMQNDALKHEQLKRKMLFEPDILEQAEADVHLIATLMELGKLIPSKTKATARRVVKKVVDDLMRKLQQKTIASISGAIDKAARNRRPRHNEINWNATIRKNLKHYQPDFKTIIPEVKIGYGRKIRRSVKDIILCIDQSGSMGTSVVYSGIFGAVMASLPNVRTQMLVFDTEVTDMTEDLKDPVDLLFGVQLGGGTDINLALQVCQQKVTKPADTILVLITDLIEGGNLDDMFQRASDLVESGVQVICLLALNDDGSPYYDKENARKFGEFGIPVFACTPDIFPDLMSAAIRKDDLQLWASKHNIPLIV